MILSRFPVLLLSFRIVVACSHLTDPFSLYLAVQLKIGAQDKGPGPAAVYFSQAGGGQVKSGRS